MKKVCVVLARFTLPLIIKSRNRTAWFNTLEILQVCCPLRETGHVPLYGPHMNRVPPPHPKLLQSLERPKPVSKEVVERCQKVLDIREGMCSFPFVNKC